MSRFTGRAHEHNGKLIELIVLLPWRWDLPIVLYPGAPPQYRSGVSQLPTSQPLKQGYIATINTIKRCEIVRIDRIRVLAPFDSRKEGNAKDMAILIKVQGKRTTDHISPAGPWYDCRGHLENILQNLLTDAENAFLPDLARGIAKDLTTGKLAPVPEAARNLQRAGFK
jgi:hypothetical protein